jgi:peptidoglycan hydrolase-like protein with peptidoglycan-binding domain
MNKLIVFVCLALLFCAPAYAQSTQTSAGKTNSQSDKPRKPIFRATKDQIIQVQKKLGAAETGKMDDDFREEIKKFQTGNGLRQTGTLNRATLEKMGIELTESQREIPVDPKSFASADDKKAAKRGPVFRATKDQVIAAQRVLKDKNFYAGEANGSLDDATRAALKQFQEANGMKPTGTLNQATLEKMRIELTEKQKETFAKLSQ